MQPLTENLLVKLAAVHPRPGHHHRRADPLRRDLLLPLQPPAAGGVHPVPPGACLRGPGQGRGAEIEAERLGEAAPEKLTAVLDKVGDGSAAGEKRTQFGSCRLCQQAPATAPPGNRRPPARRCWAASPTSAMSSPPSATAPTASTGESCPSHWTRARPLHYAPGDCVFVPGIRARPLRTGIEDIPARVISDGRRRRGPDAPCEGPDGR